MRSTLYAGEPIAGSHVFTGESAARALPLNELAASLNDPANRAAFLDDEAAYVARFDLNEEQRRMLSERDWSAMVAHGGTVYLLLKIAATLGSNLLEIGARMRGEALDDFMRTRPGARATPRYD